MEYFAKQAIVNKSKVEDISSATSSLAALTSPSVDNMHMQDDAQAHWVSDPTAGREMQDALNVKALEASWLSYLQAVASTCRDRRVSFPPTAVHFRRRGSYMYQPAEVEIQDGIVRCNVADKQLNARGGDDSSNGRQWRVIAVRGQKVDVVAVREMTLEATMKTESGRFAIRFPSKRTLQEWRCAVLMRISDSVAALESSEVWRPASPRKARLRGSDAEGWEPVSRSKVHKSMMRSEECAEPELSV